MHTLKITLFILFFSILKTELNAQPSQFNYQAVARNASGAPIANQAIKIRLKIHDLAANDNVIYSETRTANTNSFGLFSVAIGSSGATDVTGNLTNIPWGDGIKFLHVEMDPLGGINFVDMGTTQLLSVPYALQANHLTLPSAQTAITNTSAFLIE